MLALPVNELMNELIGSLPSLESLDDSVDEPELGPELESEEFELDWNEESDDEDDCDELLELSDDPEED